MTRWNHEADFCSPFSEVFQACVRLLFGSIGRWFYESHKGLSYRPIALAALRAYGPPRWRLSCSDGFQQICSNEIPLLLLRVRVEFVIGPELNRRVLL